MALLRVLAVIGSFPHAPRSSRNSPSSRVSRVRYGAKVTWLALSTVGSLRLKHVHGFPGVLRYRANLPFFTITALLHSRGASASGCFSGSMWPLVQSIGGMKPSSLNAVIRL